VTGTGAAHHQQVDEKELHPQERMGNNYPHDRLMWDLIDEAIETHETPRRDVLESFAVYVRRYNMTRFLAHYELYRMVSHLNGSIVEAGVYRGASLLAFAKFLEIFHPGNRLRKVIGFDNFAGFTEIDLVKDGPESPHQSKVPGGWDGGKYYDELVKLIDVFHRDSFVPRAKRIELVEGDIEQTAPAYVAANPGARVCLLHLDIDLYAPTLAALEAFYPLIVDGGIVVLDEYGAKDWAGESVAVEEYFAGRMPTIKSLNWASTPTGYFVKGEDD